MKTQTTGLGLLAAAVTFAGAAQAQVYQAELGASYIDTTVDTPFGEFDDTGMALDFTWHFVPVNTSGYPLAEAAYLNQASNFALAYATTDESEVDTLAGQIELYLNSLYLRGGLARVDVGDDDSLTDYSLRIGFMAAPGFRLAAGMDVEDGGDGPGAEDLDTIVIEAKHVSDLVGTAALNLEGALNLVDDEADTMLLELAGDYYFNSMFSAGITYDYVDSDNEAADDDAIGARTRYFFTPAFSGELYFVSSDNVDQIGVRGALRF